jgi:hypothetical protein
MESKLTLLGHALAVNSSGPIVDACLAAANSPRRKTCQGAPADRRLRTLRFADANAFA